MQLRDARLCADCDEVHDAQQCPHCASEKFSYISRWVPLPERRKRPRPLSSPQAEIYRQLIEPKPESTPSPSAIRRVLKRGAIGMTALGVASWLWRSAERARETPTQTPAEPPRKMTDSSHARRVKRRKG